MTIELLQKNAEAAGVDYGEPPTPIDREGFQCFASSQAIYVDNRIGKRISAYLAWKPRSEPHSPILFFTPEINIILHKLWKMMQDQAKIPCTVSYIWATMILTMSEFLDDPDENDTFDTMPVLYSMATTDAYGLLYCRVTS